MRKSIIPVFVPHKGCPNQCVFCNQRSISGCNKETTPDEVAEILKSGLLKAESNNCQVAFYGGSFTAIPMAQQEALLNVCGEALSRKKLSGIRISTRPDCINEEILEFLKRKGVKTIELGVQSFDDGVLLRSKRGHTSKDAVLAAGLVKEAGFELVLQIMAGLPGSNESLDLYTARKAAALAPDGVRIYPVCVFPDTGLFSMWEKGEYEPLTIEEGAYITARMLDIFDEAGIAVIRTGLNHSEDAASSVAAGPYHPAFGELARACQNYLHICKKLDEMGQVSDKLIIYASNMPISQVAGHRRENIEKLKEKYGFSTVKIVSKKPQVGEFYIEL